jgi:hypothetical protein
VAYQIGPNNVFIENGTILNITSVSTLYNTAVIINKGTINNNDGTILNYGEIINNGIINNGDIINNGIINNSLGKIRSGTVDNSNGIIYITDELNFTSTLTNNSHKIKNSNSYGVSYIMYS